MSTHYDHTQTGRFHWLIAALGVGCLVGFAFAPSPSRLILLVMAGVFGVLTASFARLRVHDDGDRLRLRFGPLAWLGWSFRYDEVEDVAVSRSRLIDGWGLHYVPWRGWTVNLWGFDCVEFRVRGGGRRRIGTDDPRGLAEHLRERAAAARAPTDRSEPGRRDYSATRGSG